MLGQIDWFSKINEAGRPVEQENDVTLFSKWLKKHFVFQGFLAWLKNLFLWSEFGPGFVFEYYFR